jgi:hypothetical protein
MLSTCVPTKDEYGIFPDIELNRPELQKREGE